MRTDWYIGFDPGKSGAIALLRGEQLIDVADMPIVADKVSPALVAEIVTRYCERISGYAGTGGVTCVIEDVSAMPGQGVTSMFTFGRSKGVLEGVCAAKGLRTTYVRPSQWKRDLRISKEKASARRLATELWPARAGLFARVKDDGRAEAALIALWGVRHD